MQHKGLKNVSEESTSFGQVPMADAEKVVKNGLWLFLDTIVVSLQGWVFWFVISLLTTPEEIGYSTTVIQLVTLTSSFFGLGLDYSLLKCINTWKSNVLGSILALEVIMLAALSPLIFVVGVNMYGSALNAYMAMGTLFMILSGAVLISRSASLGLFESRRVFLWSSFGAMVRLISGVLLVLWGFGGIGIFFAGLLQMIVVFLGLLAFCYRKVGLGFGQTSELKNLLKVGLSNFPTKISTVAISSLSIILLGAVTSDPSVVGTFYLALLISLLGGSLASSLATMALPASTVKCQDMTSTSLRIGLCLTAPIVAVLLSAPNFVLSLLGEAYVTASKSLVILALAIVPTILASNALTRLNHKGMLKQLAYLGVLQLIAFLIPFLFLASTYRDLGAATAVLASSGIAGLISLRWLGRDALKPTTISLVSIVVGWIVGTFLGVFPQPLNIIFVLSASVATVFAFRGVTPKELICILKSLRS